MVAQAATKQSIIAEDLARILDLTKNVWEELRGARIFLTGGTGFFGTWLLETLAAANEKHNLNFTVYILSRDVDTFLANFPHLGTYHAFKFQLGDIRTYEFPTMEFTHVIHLAATNARTTFEGTETPLDKIETLMNGTKRILEFSGKSGAKKVLFTSSGAMYGQLPPGMTSVSEDYRGAPDPANASNNAVWGQGKRMAEMYCHQYAARYNFEVKIARCFSFVGPYLPLDIHYAIGNFIRDTMNGGPIQISGDGTPVRSYMYTTDLVVWLLTILLKGENGRAYNVGSQEGVSIYGLAHKTATYGRNVTVTVAQQAPSLHAPDCYVPCTRRAQTELGLIKAFDLEQALERTILFHTSPDR